MIESLDTVDKRTEGLDFLSNGKSIDTARDVEKSIDMEDDLEFPVDEDILEMVKDVDLDKPLATVTERYFVNYYRMNFPKEGDDICIRIHTNRLCMISLAPSHAIFDNDKKIEKIDFQVTEKLNRANNTVSGKSKHGAQPLHETSKICSITCSNGDVWIVRCGINGKLTEANTDLLENPELLKQPPHKGGYLAIVLPKLEAVDKMKQQLMTQDAYDAAILQRLREKNEKEELRAVKRPSDNDNSEFKEKIPKIDVKENRSNIVDKNIVSSTLTCT